MTKPNPNEVTLESPIKKGDTEITKVILRKPQPSEMRGLKLAELLQMDVSSVEKVLPRISMPPLDPAQIAEMDVADFSACAQKVMGFLVPKSAQSKIKAMEGNL